MQAFEETEGEWARQSLLEYLVQHGIAFDEVLHHAVFTMEESAALGLRLAGSRCKNLLVQNKKGTQRFLVVAGPQSSIDLTALGHLLDVGRLSLCPATEMQAILGVEPGSLSPLALIADRGPIKVRLLLDEQLRAQHRFLFHPLVNTSTIAINADGLKKFLASTGHGAQYLAIPARST